MLKTNFFAGTNTPPEERAQILLANADRVIEDYEYTKILTEAELAARREEKVDADIRLHRATEELKAHNKAAKAEMVPDQRRAKELLGIIAQQAEQVSERAYMVRDDSTFTMQFFNGEGEQIYVRSMTPEERQGNMFRPTNN